MANTTAKVTKVQKFEMVKALIPQDRTDLIEFIQHEIDLTNTRNSRKSDKPSKDKIAHDVERAKILDVIKTNGKPMTVSEIASETDLSIHKVTGLLLPMWKNTPTPQVTRNEVKGKAYYTVA